MSVNQRTLQIKKGGKISFWDWDSDIAGYTEIDVTNSVSKWLFEPCLIEEGVTLRDIFSILNTDLDFFGKLINCYLTEFVPEGLSSTEEKEDGLEYLELKFYPEHSIDKKYGNSFYGMMTPHFSGIGYILDKDTDFSKKGDRITYSVAFTEISKLMDIPVKLNDIMEITVADYDVKNWHKNTITFDGTTFTFIQIILGIFEEISFHGNTENKNDHLEQLNNILKKAKDELGND